MCLVMSKWNYRTYLKQKTDIRRPSLKNVFGMGKLSCHGLGWKIYGFFTTCNR